MVEGSLRVAKLNEVGLRIVQGGSREVQVGPTWSYEGSDGV